VLPAFSVRFSELVSVLIDKVVKIEFSDGIKLHCATKMQVVLIRVDTALGRKAPSISISFSANATNSVAPFSTRTLFVFNGNKVRGKSSRKNSFAE
jgi:hypothetical protein